MFTIGQYESAPGSELLETGEWSILGSDIPDETEGEQLVL